jgi:hypothetical protein
MLAGIVLGVGLAVVVASRVVADGGAPLGLIGALVGTVSAVGLVPVLVGTSERFGLAVMGVSVARLLLGCFAALMLTSLGDAPARPVWLGVASGLGVVLLAESVLAIVVLSQVERIKAAGALPAGVESSQAC